MKYEGGCHCGKVRFEVEADLSQTIECNCSHCSMKGFILAFTPKDAFTLTKGEGETQEYLFNTGKIHHRFCKTCGVESYANGVGPGGAAMAAINVRCLDGVDIAALEPMPVNGAAA